MQLRRREKIDQVVFALMGTSSTLMKTDPNEKNELGESRLMLAAKKGCIEEFDELLKLNGNIGLKDHRSNTILSVAILELNTDIVMRLVEVGFDVNRVSGEKVRNRMIHDVLLMMFGNLLHNSLTGKENRLKLLEMFKLAIDKGAKMGFKNSSNETGESLLVKLEDLAKKDPEAVEIREMRIYYEDHCSRVKMLKKEKRVRKITPLGVGPKEKQSHFDIIDKNQLTKEVNAKNHFSVSSSNDVESDMPSSDYGVLSSNESIRCHPEGILRDKPVVSNLPRTTIQHLSTSTDNEPLHLDESKQVKPKSEFMNSPSCDFRLSSSLISYASIIHDSATSAFSRYIRPTRPLHNDL